MDVQRLTRMLENDEAGSMRGTLRVAQADLMNLLCEFMDVKKLDMRVEKSGNAYTLTVTAEVDKIYDIGKISG